MPEFEGSAVVQWLEDPTPTAQSESVVAALIGTAALELDVAARNELIAAIIGKLRNGQFRELTEWDSRLVILGGSIQADSLRKFLASRHVLRILPGSPFTIDHPLPSAAELVAVSSANYLFDYGHSQFQVLAALCSQIVHLCTNNVGVTLIEAPRGNSVPVRSLHRLLASRNVQVKILRLDAPRNTKAARGVTVKQAVNTLVNEIPEKDHVIYIDDVISSGRFRKMYDSLKQCAATRGLKLTGLALATPLLRPLSNEQAKMRESLKRTLLEDAPPGWERISWTEFPMLPTFRLDAGAPFAYEAPLVWGDDDIVAGMRKVNFVFSLIDVFSHISNDLERDDSEYRTNLIEHLWSQDVTGARFVISPQIALDGFKQFNSALNWESIRKKAKDAFQSDYSGDLTDMPEEQLKLRWEWLVSEIRSSVAAFFGERAGNLMARAIIDVFVTFVANNVLPDRDYDYQNYFIEYRPQLRAFHDRIVERIVEAASYST